jgi:Ger(x)C family germination protein
VFALKTAAARLTGHKPGKSLAVISSAAVLLASLWLARNAVLAESLSLVFERWSFAFCSGFGLLTLLISWLRQKRRPVKAAALLLALILFAGCRYREPDEELAALLIGYDKGESAKYKITFTLMPETGKEAAPIGDENAGANIFSVEADSSLAAIDTLGAILPKRVSLLHTRAIVISEELARLGIEEIIAPVSVTGEINSNATVIISNCRAEDYLRAPELAISPSLPMTLEMLLQKTHGSSASGFMTISHFLSDMRSEYGGAITLLAGRAGILPVEGSYDKQLAGMALFCGDKLVGTLDARETAHWQILVGTMAGGTYTVRDPKKPQSYVSFTANSVSAPKVYAKAGPVPRIIVTARLSLRAALVQNQDADYTDANVSEGLHLYTKKQIEAELTALIKKTQALGCDILQLGRHCAGEFLTIQDWRAYDWPTRYREAEISIISDLSII